MSLPKICSPFSEHLKIPFRAYAGTERGEQQHRSRVGGRRGPGYEGAPRVSDSVNLQWAQGTLLLACSFGFKGFLGDSIVRSQL